MMHTTRSSMPAVVPTVAASADAQFAEAKAYWNSYMGRLFQYGPDPITRTTLPATSDARAQLTASEAIDAIFAEWASASTTSSAR